MILTENKICELCSFYICFGRLKVNFKESDAIFSNFAYAFEKYDRGQCIPKTFTKNNT